MKYIVSTVLTSVFVLCGIGCVSVIQHSSYSPSHSAADDKATLWLGYNFRKVSVDGEAVKFRGRGFGTSAWKLELSSGEHAIEAIFGNYNRCTGQFFAKKGREYVLCADVIRQELGGGVVLIQLLSAYITEVPEGHIHTLTAEQRMGFLNIKDDVQKAYPKVAILQKHDPNE
jgi:hypothetical protein